MAVIFIKINHFQAFLDKIYAVKLKKKDFKKPLRGYLQLSL